uniref:MIF4G domain-containing protein n=1 Tax=Trichuris muris TaxID=70415 RepID=A0A5S6R1U7_TRIMR
MAEVPRTQYQSEEQQDNLTIPKCSEAFPAAKRRSFLGIQPSFSRTMNDESRSTRESPGGDAAAYFEGLCNRLRAKALARQKNLNAVADRPDENTLRTLDNSLKKNTAFVRRLRTFTENQLDALVKDFLSLNLSRYVAEMVTSLCDAKLKVQDVSAAVQLCSLAHQRYSDFATLMLEYFKKVFSLLPENKISNMSKFGMDLHFLSELLLVGIFTEKDAFPVLQDALTIITRNDKEKFVFLPTLISFCKQSGLELLGVVPTRYNAYASDYELPQLVAVESQEKLQTRIVDFYNYLVKHVSRYRVEVQKAEQKVSHQLENRGEAHPQTTQRLEELKSEFGKLYQMARELADLLDKAPPDIGDEKSEQSALSADREQGIHGPGLDKSSRPLWEDDETRMFYESYPNLEEMLPPILFVKDRSHKQSNFREKEIEAMRALEKEISERCAQERSEEDGEKLNTMETVSEEMDEKSASVEPCEEDGNLDDSAENEEEVEYERCTNVSLRQEMESFLIKLPNLINRDLIDQAAIDFATNMNSKANRRRLLKALFEVHRTRLDLLPFYGRLIAILSPVMQDIGIEISRMLMGEFRHHLRKKDQVSIESKIKVVRYIGELVKFRVFSATDAVYCLRLLLIEFRHHHIDMVCNMLESCGYFLLHQPESHQRISYLLQVLKRRIKSMVHIEPRHQLMIHNAYYACYPPEIGEFSGVEKVEMTPMQKYIRYLFDELNEETLDGIQVQFEKLNWKDPDVYKFVIRCMSRPWDHPCESSALLGCLIAGLMTSHPSIGFQVADNVLEDIRLDLEMAGERINQHRRRASIQLLGQLYNYRVVETAVILNTLYMLITFGIGPDPTMPEFVNPRECGFRAILVCDLLDLCGSFFFRGMSRRRLDYFLGFFQRFWLSLPIMDELDEEALATGKITAAEVIFARQLKHKIEETVRKIRPDFNFQRTYAETDEEVKGWVQKYTARCQTSMHQWFDVDSTVDNDKEEIIDSFGLDPHAEEVCMNEIDFEEQEQRTTSIDEEESSSMLTPKTALISMSSDDLSQLTKSEDDTSSAGATTDSEGTLFSRELDRVINDMVLQRISEQSKAPPIAFYPPNVDKLDGFQSDAMDDTKSEDLSSSRTVKFVLMAKGKQSKPLLKTLEVPVDCDIALNLKSRTAEDLREKERMKQLTLNMTQRLDEEEIAACDCNGQNSSPMSKPMVFTEPRKAVCSPQIRMTYNRTPSGSRDLYASRWY